TMSSIGALFKDSDQDGTILDDLGRRGAEGLSWVTGGLGALSTGMGMNLLAEGAGTAVSSMVAGPEMLLPAAALGSVGGGLTLGGLSLGAESLALGTVGADLAEGAGDFIADELGWKTPVAPGTAPASPSLSDVLQPPAPVAAPAPQEP